MQHSSEVPAEPVAAASAVDTVAVAGMIAADLAAFRSSVAASADY